MKTYTVQGMTCDTCEKVIKKKLEKLDCVSHATASFKKRSVTVTYTGTEQKKVVEQALSPTYTLSPSKVVMSVYTILLVMLGYGLFMFSNTLNFDVHSVGYGLIFMAGLVTGFHCVGMCGGFMMSYIAKGVKDNVSPWRLHARYAVAKTVSYTVIGAMFGLLGSFIAFTPQLKATIAVAAGIFLILFGLNMLNVLPSVRVKVPRLNKALVVWRRKFAGNPTMVGLLNGLMIACGPLQAVYILAAGTGSMIEGASLLFMFGLGTLPVMLGFGALASKLGIVMKHIIKYSGIIIVILGIIMLHRGMILSGNTLSTVTGEQAVIQNNVQVINMDVTRYGWEPAEFTLVKGVPVQWVINGKEITGCNRAIQVPAYNLEFDIVPGEQVIEFTPTETGTVAWSCWMGMIPGTFTVVDNE